MSYTELEHGYQGLRKAAGPVSHFFVPDDIISGELELCADEDGRTGSMSTDSSDHDGSSTGTGLSCSKQVLVGVCAMAKKSQSKPMKEILTRLQEFEYIKMTVFPEEVILKKSVKEWPVCDCLISFHSKGFPLDKAIAYAALHQPYVINNLHMQYDIQDRRRVYSILEAEGIEIPRYAVLDRDSPDPKHHELVESEDHVEVNGVIFNKPFVEKPVSAEDHNIYIYYPTSAGGGSQRLFRKIGSRSSVYSPESRVRKTGSFIYEDFMPTDGTDVKVYTVGPDYAHAEARKSPALDGKVERDSEGKEIRYPVILSNAEKLISRKVCLAFKQAVCGFDLLRANGKSFVCDVNGFSFVKNSNKYYDDCAKILGNMILRELAPTLHIPWSVPFQLDDPPIVPTTFGKMMELRCVVAVIRHGDRTPKQKMKVEVRHPKFFDIFAKYEGYKHGHVKLKKPKQLQEILDIARYLLSEIAQREAQPEIEEKQGKLEQLKSVLEMYGHFSGINRKVQMKFQPRGRPRGSSSDDGKPPRSTENSAPGGDPSLVLILKWGGELTPAGRIQAEELGRIFRCMYPGGQGRHLSGEYAGTQGLGLLRLHSTFRHDLKIYASDEGRVQMTAAAFAKGLLALEGELTPILVQMVKSANTNGLLDNDCDSSKYQNMCKARLHELMQLEREFTEEEKKAINPGNAISISAALDFVKNPARCCRHVNSLIHSLMDIVRTKRDDPKTKDAILYHGETWELMGRRWGKIEKDFCNKNKKFDISKIPDIYDCIKYDLQHNQHTLQFEQAEELYMYAKYLADIVIPQEYGLTVQEKLTIGQGICTPLLKKIRADLQRNIEETGDEEETVNRLNPRYSHGVSSPGRHVRTRLYFTSESHVHSLLTVLRYGGLLDIKKDEQWRRAMQYISMVTELNYMAQLVIMLYEDPTKDPTSEERFHVELHFSPGVNCCVQKNLPPGPGFRPHSRSESATASGKNSNGESTATSTPRTEESGQCSTRIDEESELSNDVTPTDDQSRRNSQTLTCTDNCELLETTPTSDILEDETYKRKHKASDPIPIGSSHTVSGHEAAHLAKRLTIELQQQSGRSLNYGIGRSGSPEPEPRARSFDHQRQDTAQTVEPTGAAAVNVRRHRHGIAGQMSYFKMLGFGFCGGPIGLKKIGAGSTNSLFSTAVISGSSSAPNLRDMIPNTASASTLEGFGGVPPIRPLETLHNALSLRQLDTFLDHMTSQPLYRTPASSPPKNPSTPIPTPPPSAGNSSISCIGDSGVTTYAQSSAQNHPLRLQSPNNSLGWSGPPSFVSSSGPSSPAALSDVYSRESSDMSASLISSDGYGAMSTSGTGPVISQMFPTAPGLDDDLGSVGMLLESGSYIENFCHQSHQQDSGEITPVSGSEYDFNTGDATAGSTADTDVTVTEDLSEEPVILPQEESDDKCNIASNSSICDQITSSKQLPDFGKELEDKSQVGDDIKDVLGVQFNKYVVNKHVTKKETKDTNTVNVKCSTENCNLNNFFNFKPTQLLKNNISQSLTKENDNLVTFCSNNLGDITIDSHRIDNQDKVKNSNLDLMSSFNFVDCKSSNDLIDSNFSINSSSILNKQYTNSGTPTTRHSNMKTDIKNFYTNIFEKDVFPNSTKVNLNVCSAKWSTKKEKFLESKLNTSHDDKIVITKESLEKNLIDVGKNLNIGPDKSKCEKQESELRVPKVNPGAIVVKESFIEPPKMSRVSKSFHGKTSNGYNGENKVPRRCSAGLSQISNALIDDQPLSKFSPDTISTSVNFSQLYNTINPNLLNSKLTNQKPVRRNSDAENSKPKTKHTFVTQLSHPFDDNIYKQKHSLLSENIKRANETIIQAKPRFTTTLVDEATHSQSYKLAQVTQNLTTDKYNSTGSGAGNTQLTCTDAQIPLETTTPDIKVGSESYENHADIFATNHSVEKASLETIDVSPNRDLSQIPTLTLASSLTDKPSITHGFNIKKDKQ